MPHIDEDELSQLKQKIERMNLTGAKQALLGMAEILVHKPSVLAHLFKLVIDDAVLLTLETDGKKNGAPK